jgi:hypothetical protein
MELAKKEIGQYLDVELKLDGGELVAIQKLDLAALLDDAGAKLKASIPGSVEEPFVDFVVKALKDQLGLKKPE